jgi:aryl-alcohol dehydrogenase-like predicted oxidoreductase
LPFNIFDYRWNNLVDKVLAVKKKRNLIIHARSSLLQGLLCSNNSTNFLKAGISNYKDVIKFLKIYYKKYQRTSVADLCLGYANSQHWIDSVVVGVRSISNLYSNIKSISMPSLTDNCLKDINKERPKIHEQSLNPRLWS